jgi:hypothetical protein
VNINRALLLKYFLIILVALPLFYSCSIQKRYHRKGYTITWKKNDRVKSHSPSKKLIVEKQEVRDKIVSSKSKSDSTSRIVENNGRMAIESEPEPKDEGYVNSLERKETKAPFVRLDLRQKLKNSIKSSIIKENNKKDIPNSTKTAQRICEKMVKSITKFKKPAYFEEVNSLLRIGLVLLLVGLVLYITGGIFELTGFALVSSIFFISATVVWVFAGIALLMAIYSALLCIITLGMIC